MRLLCALIVLFGVFVAGCATPSRVSTSTNSIQTPESDKTQVQAVDPPPPTATNPFERTDLNQDELALVGSWHAGPYVAAGHQERYVFEKDRTFVFLPSDYIENKQVVQSKGKWYMDGATLHLLITRQYDANVNTIDTHEEIALHVVRLPIEQTENRVVITMDGKKFWAMNIDMSRIFDDNLLAKLPDYSGTWVATNSKLSLPTTLDISKVTPLQIDGRMQSVYDNGNHLPSASFQGRGFGGKDYQVSFTDSFGNEFSGNLELEENQVTVRLHQLTKTGLWAVEGGELIFVRKK